MSARRAARLARRAGTGPGSGVLARRAWRRLLAAGDAGDRKAIEAVWQRWLREPRPEAFEALRRWRPTFTRDICEWAVSPVASPAMRATLARLCIEHGLAPGEPVERVVFHLLTGQFEKVHDSDPDGTLITEGYQTAAPAVRAMLREALTADGDLDLPGILARTNRAAGLADNEVELLTGHLAATGEWERLWRLTTELPVRSAVTTVRRFDDWCPGDAAGRQLFARLARADPDMLAQAERELAATPTRITVLPDLRAAAFAPDGRSIVLASSDGMWQADAVRRFSLPGGQPLAQWPVPLREGALLDLGDVVVAEVHDRYHLYELTADGHRRTLADEQRYDRVGNGMNSRPLIPSGDGFITIVDGSELLVGSGRPLTVRRIPALRMPPPRWASCHPLAVDPDSGRLAVHGHRSIAVLAPSRQAVAWTDDTGPVHEAVFLGPDRLVTSDHGRLTRWQVDGRRLIPEATGPSVGWLTHVTALRDRGQVLAVGPRTHGSRMRLRLFDAETLDPADDLPALLGRPAWCVWASQDGGRIVFSDRDRTAHVHDVVSESVLDVLTRPAARLGPVDADRVDNARRRAAGGTGPEGWRRDYGPAVHEALDVLAAVLRHRLET
ncbi:hypothetical protein OHA72_51285 [Dactylosporangium sp. NBC_01737]|uniref:WD40 repeat domain-containing protein n=1 Tax=Dactylosporangium sp. NBC_01737 TaxID=2975959 RepID=UPI002E15E839|nr:hypothetical protein OHA72_51285 [Dactylosporangium sp. NBC_01737]